MSKRLIVVLLIVLLFLTACNKTENDKPIESTKHEEVSETVPSSENEAGPGEEESIPEGNKLRKTSNQKTKKRKIQAKTRPYLK